MLIPIVRRHDYTDIVGKLYNHEGILYAEFNSYISQSKFFSIFNCGARFIDMYVDDKDTMFVKKAEILEFSIDWE